MGEGKVSASFPAFSGVDSSDPSGLIEGGTEVSGRRNGMPINIVGRDFSEVGNNNGVGSIVVSMFSNGVWAGLKKKSDCSLKILDVFFSPI